MDYQTLLNEGESLSRVARYEVSRPEGRIIIDVHKVLSGPGDAHFVAMPFLTLVGTAKRGFCGHGSTENDALRDCLAKLQNKRFEEITAAADVAEN